MIDYSGEVSDNLKCMRIKRLLFGLRMEECEAAGDHERAEVYRQRLEAVSAAIAKLKREGKDKPDKPDTYGYP